jgi:hypothetical protein
MGLPVQARPQLHPVGAEAEVDKVLGLPDELRPAGRAQRVSGAAALCFG